MTSFKDDEHVTVAAFGMESQTEQEFTLELKEYSPASQAIQLVAPVDVPVFVIDIALQLVHAATLDALEYVPTPHAKQVVAPALIPEFVIEPASHRTQALSPAVP
tara:strand:- start:81 stop:395 length:315 start_codon:yes stop_codon:yes gene_type:complete